MKILIGTANPSKTKLFANILSLCNMDYVTLDELSITDAPEETGRTPEENSIIKAKFYGRYFDKVLCNDSGLYFCDLPIDDERQPGIFVRRPNGQQSLNDDEMIEYYSNFVHSLGGKMLAAYCDAFAVYDCGKVYSYMDDPLQLKDSAFYMVDVPSKERNVGWPLDSLSVNKDTLKYFSESRNDILFKTNDDFVIKENTRRLIDFLKNVLES